MHFDWFSHVAMIYWRTNAYVMSPLTISASSLNNTNRFHVAVALYSYNSQKTSKCAKNISDKFSCAQLVLGIQ